MSRKMIGIELGVETLKLAVVKNGRIVKLAVEKIPTRLIADGRVAAPELLSRFLKDSMKKNRISGRNCAFALPSQIVVSQRLRLPQMTGAELRLNLPYEFQDYVGSLAEEYLFDYIVTGIHEGMMDLYAAAVRKQDVEDFYQVFRDAGLILRQAMPTEMAWLNVVRNAARAPGSLCIVDVGHEKTSVNIYKDKQFVMGKNIDLGGRLFDSAIARQDCLEESFDAVAMEILKTMTFYAYSEGAEPVADLYLCGGSANMEGLRQAIVQATDMVPHRISDLLMTDDEQMALRCGLAAGAALQKEKGA